MTDETTAQRQRRQELNRIARHGFQHLGSPFTTKVVGMTYVPGYPDNLLRLRQVMDEIDPGVIGVSPYGEGVPAVLIRNPANEHDSNAIQVHVPEIGDGGMVGHLTAPIAARLAPELDAGVTWVAAVVSVLVTPGHEDRPGISVRLVRVPDER